MKPYYYVFRVGHGNSNVKHLTIDAAQKESERICNQHPGSVFEILKCVASVQCTQAATLWMDGEGPPETPRYRMLEDGDFLQKGDQIEVGGNWRCRAYGFGERFNSSMHVPHRRPL